jgi:hypothetical protein
MGSVRITTDYAIAVMRLISRARGAVLRLVRRRLLSIAVGVALAAPAGWVELFARDVSWWMEGGSLVVGATGLALIWTGLTGASPDWIEDP